VIRHKIILLPQRSKEKSKEKAKEKVKKAELSTPPASA
jgi:hypothetical protein